MMTKENRYHKINKILHSYGVTIQKDDLSALFLEPNQDKSTLYRYAWIGDKVIDMVLGIKSYELFGDYLDNEHLHQIKNVYCTNAHFEFLMYKIGLRNYIVTPNRKDIETVFEALIYLIYKGGREDAVLSFLKKIDFLTKEELHNELLKFNQNQIKYIDDAIATIKRLLEQVNYRNSALRFYAIYREFKKVIECVYKSYYAEEHNRVNFREVLETVIKQIGKSNRFQNGLISIIQELGEMIELLENGLNKNEQRIDVFIREETVKKTVNKYVLGALLEMRSLTDSTGK